MIVSKASATVAVRVRAYLVGNAAGEGAEPPARHGFTLHCLRLDAEAYAARLAANPMVADLMASLVVGWADIDLRPGEPAPFTGDGVRLLLGIPNLAAIALREYERAINAKAAEVLA